MEAGGGAARPEPPSGEGARLEQSQMQLDGPVVLNRSAELESSDAMDIDATPAQALKQTVPPPTQSPAATLTDTVVQVQKQLKRKRASNGPVIAPAEKEALADGCRLELQGLFEYYKEVSGHKMQIDGGGNLSTNAMIGCLLEESNLGLSKLVDEAFEKLKGTEGVSVASVRSSVLLIGQRMMYGQSSPDADVLEDESELSLWCWEVRDLKVLPVRTRGFLSARRTARKKIHERITALHSATLSALESTGAEGQVNELRKVSMKLSKALNLEGIRSMVERVTQKNNIQRGAKDVESTDQSMQVMENNEGTVGGVDAVNGSGLPNGNAPANEQVILKMQKQSQKETKRQEKEEHQMMKQQKKMQEEALREQKRREKEEAEVKKRQKRQEEEALKEQKRREKEEAEMRKQEKKQQEDALKEQKRREKEEAEMRKQQKKQQEEADKEQKRLEKEAAQLKKQLAIQKQALLMQRLFKSNDSEKPKSGENDSDACSVDPGTTKKEISAATSIIDSSFNLKESWTLEYLQRLQITGWQKLSNYNRSSRWGIRHKPKEAFKELKLQKTSDDMIDEILSAPNEDACHNSGQENEPDKLGNDIDMLPASEVECHVTRNDNSLPTRLIKRKLLQFAKSNRPAYYGTWRKKSAVIRPKCPLMMDPDLDYEIDSDDEWEEVDPGESLSDCEKDTDEVMDEEDSKITDEEEEDSFVVPDGYLSDSEGIQVESLLDEKADDASSLPTSQCPEVEEFRTLLRQQKVLNTLTEQALRKSQPLVISNLAHEKADLLTAQDLKGSLKIEQLCLQVLSMRICPGGGVVDVPAIDSSSAASEETNQSNAKSSPAAASSVLDTDLQEIVQVIQSSRDGIHKLVELLHQKFPTVKKTQLNHKVREISDFVDNRWQVKKEVLDKLGLTSSPPVDRPQKTKAVADRPSKTKGIGMYFSKRCLPPEEAVNALASSPELRLKPRTVQGSNGVAGAPQVDLFPSQK
ncbi:chromatin assembly factor 1 subunit FSM isoform X1 [Aegilops tauschii subsp. strangulata]|uniref:Chromatin assembly factor 1 subunit FSM n=2 Tax=Aegilops tauschii subsp. strangulata TaxID=200361 RepID=A0A453LHP2_AEGTS|nr:chromatin assembly factor 1 subunit FSM isoform X1 [Aegilops tauschii subsp. strangulata]